MNKIRLKASVYVLISISIIIFIILLYFNQQEILRNDIKEIASWKKWASLISTVISIDLFIIFLFTKYIWKYSCFYGWLVPFPDLTGTWEGMIQSNWINPKTNKKIDPIPTTLTIVQSFFHMSCVMYTGEMRSDSYAEIFFIEEERQVKELCYFYKSDPKLNVKERSANHNGAMKFKIEDNCKTLKGIYWTERQTSGEIELNFVSKNISGCLPKGLGPHPMAQTK